MAKPKPDTWAQTHMRWLALSRWDNEGGASPLRPTSGSARTPLRNNIWPAIELAGIKDPALLLAPGVTKLHTALRLE